jgi:hypothetical protein
VTDRIDAGRSGLAWSLLSQGCAALSNGVVTIGVAALANGREAGEFGLAMVLFVVTAVIVRALGGDALLLATDPSRFEAHVVTLALLSAAGGVVVGVTLMATRDLPATAVWVIGGLVLLVLQDACRYLCFARRDPRSCAMADGVWCVVMLLVASIAAWSGGLEATELAAAWVIGGGVSLMLLLSRLHPAARLVRHPMWDPHTQWWLLAEAAALSGPVHAVTVIAGVTAGIESVAALRVLQVVFGPMSLIFTAWYVSQIGRVVERARTQPTVVMTTVVRVGAMLAVVSLSLGFVVLALPRDVGVAVAGDVFVPARSVVVPTAIATALTAVAAALVAGVRVHKRFERVVLARLVYAGVVCASTAVGGLIAGLSGVVWALVLSNGVGLAPLVVGLRRSLPQPDGRAGVSGSLPASS